jgi:tRNA (guanine-N7-)-methyltransferase
MQREASAPSPSAPAASAPPAALKRARPGAKLDRATARVDAGGKYPQRRDFKQRAHINPMNHQLYEYPVSPERAGWARHFPCLLGAGRPPGAPAAADVVDVGCGFGGLTVALAGALPGSLVLGLEIRPNVTEYVRLRLEAHRRGIAPAPPAAPAAPAGASGEGAPPPLPSHFNASVLRTNAMKFLPCLFAKGTLSKLFFCFADPQFKPANHRRRIVNTQLLAEYAYALRVGGRLYVITDVPDLFNWEVAHAGAHPLFARVPQALADADPAVAAMRGATEEAHKVAREGRTGDVQWAVFERVAGGAVAEDRGAREGAWWDEPEVRYEYTPAGGQKTGGRSREWRVVEGRLAAAEAADAAS